MGKKRPRGLRLSHASRCNGMDIGNAVVGVLFGGTSHERDVSRMSGEAVLRGLLFAGINAVPVPADEGFRPEELLERGVDIAFPALHGGEGEDGTLQARLERLGIPYIGSGPRASRIAMDKAWSKSVFRALSIPTPEWEVCTGEKHWATLQDKVGFPLVVKPATGGSSIGMRIAKTELEVQDAVTAALEVSDKAIVERFVPGRELTVGIVGEETLPVVELFVRDGFYDYEAKYSDTSGTRYEYPAHLGEIQAVHARRLALRVHRALGCRDVSRTDIILDTDGMMWVLETNTLPGMTSHSLLPKAAEAAGMGFQNLCAKLVRLAAARETARGSRRIMAA